MTPSETNADSDATVRSSIDVPPDLVVGLLGSDDENLRALEIELSHAQLDRLAAAGSFSAGFPRDFLESEHVRGLIFGDTFELIDDPRAPEPMPVAS